MRIPTAVSYFPTIVFAICNIIRNNPLTYIFGMNSEISCKNSQIMFRNYLHSAFRNILRHKGFSMIVILGLTLGISIFGLVFQFINHELSYDRFNKNYESIYRLENGGWALTGTAYAPEIAQHFPEVRSTVRVSSMEGKEVVIKVKDQLMKIDDLIFADSSFFNVFSFSFLKGNPKHAIDELHGIVLTESLAEKIFGDEDPINKSITLNNKVTYTVTGIIRDVNNFHIKMNAVAPFISLQEYYSNPVFLTQYGTWNYYTYLNLKDNVDANDLANKISDFYTNRASWPESRPEFSLRPLREIYFTHVEYDMPQDKANRSMLRIYILVAVFILIIACINFINLSIARSTTRSREIGVRKAIGATRGNLIVQFLGESVIYALIATELSLVLMEILRPVFNNLVQRQLSLLSFNLLWITFLVLLLPLLIGTIAGIYPSFYLTRFKPVTTMKSEKTRGQGSVSFRRLLIIGQFTISIVLIAATLTVYKQLTYLRNADLGFSDENIIQLGMNSSLNEHAQTFREMLMSDPDIRSVSLSTQSMDHISWQESIEHGTESKQFTYLGIDTEFFPLMDLKMKEGRSFQSDIPSDSGKAIINEEAVSYFGLKPPVVGQFIGTDQYRIEILGVVRDFHFNSLRGPVSPLLITLRNKWLSTINIKIESRNMPKTIRHIESVWNRFCPDFLFEYEFLDKKFEQLYNDEMRLGKTFMYLAFLAIFISSIGLLGLSLFLAEQRTKEIGIRKAMGDNTAGILWLFSKEFGKWVIVSGIIAMPLAYYIMNKWLGTFANRVSVDGYILTGSCLIALIIALITVIGQTHRIAARNPVDALRYE